MRILIFLICHLLIGCTAFHRNPVSRTRFERISRHYQEVVELENGVGKINLKPVIEFNTKLATGMDIPGSPPYWLIPQRILLMNFRSLYLTPAKHKELRLILVRKYGLVSSLYAMKKDDVWERFISPTDPYAFTDEDLVSNRLNIESKQTVLLELLRNYEP